MPIEPRLKFVPRNVAALRKGQDAALAGRVAGNSSSTLLESGVGNCFPGLECDIRNLERRFFPFLEVDMWGPNMAVASVDEPGVQAAVSAGQLSTEQASAYEAIAQGLANGVNWRVDTLSGTFGPLGVLQLPIRQLDRVSFGEGRRPPDAWTAVRMLTEDTEVRMSLVPDDGGASVQITGRRMRYLDDNGALSRMFEPGELTQSLCSPWTHDFRDCGCFYWASNHPDIALPLVPASEPRPLATRWNLSTPWERRVQATTTAPVATGNSAAPLEMNYHEINRDWQRLNFVFERRERQTPYVPEEAIRQPLADTAQLVAHLRYAAGVEIAVMQEYLTAAFSLVRPQSSQSVDLRNDLRAANAELMRVAIGEMRHLRMINDVLRQVMTAGTYQPALAVANQLPGGAPGQFRAIQFRAATPQALDDFIAIEAPSLAVDGLYARILATLEASAGTEESQQLVRSVMAEGEDHWQTFEFIKEWLGGHPQSSVLRGVAPPAPGNAAHVQLQQRYRALLMTLHEGYRLGLPAGAPNINQARSSMLGAAGLEGAMEAVASQNLLVVFNPIADARFSAISPPQ